LTEDDWLKFKMLLEKTHPGFFTKLKEQSNDITVAEQRMAALTRMRLTTKQMAAVLGISSNSVIKAKQRLRQRFNFQTDFHVEEFLTKL
jgi:DNA-binding CsgD family transcriptional regulator